ncbi:MULTISPECIES: FliM/FliN family flagellar motor C-terminal domain-containing protein [Vibrio]|uniref:FliM/FliN family flagellar motor switch protein n=1 Tax=Vibrio TaxID=662 RepID=UPI000C16B549|nr:MULTISPECIES: FliM/FliN family flagellar motor C-terminal domain-containing protein [Vibrio]NNN44302.1 FliM/FliN family flagellar motor switch protein [Vibrio sp. 1-1(7)]NNN72818.1 FliM/FliN family flagellar motor switch protein [Vibrio sp. 12-2(3-a)]
MANSDEQILNVELLGKPIHIIREKLFDLISESCNGLTHELQKWLKTNQIESQLQAVELHSFSPAEMEAAHTSTLRHQAGGLIYIHTDTALLITLADRFYGAPVARTTLSLTSSDIRIQEKISKLMGDWLAPSHMWQHDHFQPTSGIGLDVQITVTLNECVGLIHLKLDGQLIQTLIDQFELQSQSDLTLPFKTALMSTPVRLNAILAKKTMPLSEVIQLQAEDILPIELLNNVPLSIGNQTLFSGRVAENDGQLVLIFNQNRESHS